VNEQQKVLATKQFDFYGAELLPHPPYDIAPDTAVVAHTQGYLSHFVATTRVYQAMLADAEKASPPIDFKKQYPGSEAYVVDTKIVHGAFTQEGFAAMQDALKHLDRYANGEKWVLGDAAGTLPGATVGNSDFSSLYTNDFLKEWLAFLNSAHVTNCTSLQEAPSRLSNLGSASSPLLELFYVISHNTAVANQQIMSTFQPAHKFVDPNAKGNLIGDVNKPYVEALLQLGGQVEIAAKNPNIATDATAFVPISSAIVTATGVADQAGLTFDSDQQTHTTRTFLALLKAPIECVAKFEPSPGAAGNAGGQKICGATTQLLGRFPFNANPNAPPAALQEVDSVFAPETGVLATTYNTALNKILIPDGARFSPSPSAPGRVNPRFLTYFNHAEHISSVLYPAGAKSASLTFSLRFIPGNGVSSAALVIDGQRVPASANSQQFTWIGSTAQKVALDYDNVEALSDTGTWSLFQMVRTAQITRTSGGFRLDYPINTATTVAGHTISGSGNASKTVTFELSGPGAEFLVGDGFSGLSCMQQPVILK
jgi:type VI secretion system protein ImpL